MRQTQLFVSKQLKSQIPYDVHFYHLGTLQKMIISSNSHETRTGSRLNLHNACRWRILYQDFEDGHPNLLWKPKEIFSGILILSPTPFSCFCLGGVGGGCKWFTKMFMWHEFHPYKKKKKCCRCMQLRLAFGILCWFHLLWKHLLVVKADFPHWMCNLSRLTKVVTKMERM